MSTSRPVPQRTLPGPARLTVAQRDLDGQIGSSSRTDVQALKDDLTRRAEISRKGEKWADKLMETTPSLQTFKKAVTYLTPSQYLEVTHERHLNNHCSYPACPNASKRAFDPKKKIKISWSNRTIEDCEGNPEDGFCGRSCGVKSDWVYDRLSELDVWARASGRGFTLLEEQEKEGQDGDVGSTMNGRMASGEEGKKERSKPSIPLPPVGKPISTTRPQESTSSSTLSRLGESTKTLESATGMLGNLTITENPTPTTIPLPPSLDGPKPAAQSTTPLQSSQTHKLANSSSQEDRSTSRRKAGGLVETPSALQQNLVTASRQMGPVPQLPKDEEDEEEDQWVKEEEEMGLTWGTEDDEIRKLFAEAQAAREIE